jgi:hypothetical protein
MVKKSNRLVIASASDAKTTSFTSYNGRAQSRHVVTGQHGIVQGYEKLQTNDPPHPPPADEKLVEVKETKKSKKAGIKVEGKSRSLISVSLPSLCLLTIHKPLS